MRAKTHYQNVGFWFHLNAWPFNDRSEGYFSWSDPLPLLVAELAWPLELLRIKGALKGGELTRDPKGLPPNAGTPLTATFPSICEALGLNYHHLDVNIGKVIVPGPSPGRDYDTFEAIQQDLRGSYIRSQVWRDGSVAQPRVLCVDDDVAEALAEDVVGKEAEIKKLDAQALRHNSKLLFKTISGQGRAFNAIFLPEALLKDLPVDLLAAGGRAVATDILP
jgi:hypothetical protein